MNDKRRKIVIRGVAWMTHASSILRKQLFVNWTECSGKKLPVQTLIDDEELRALLSDVLSDIETAKEYIEKAYEEEDECAQSLENSTGLGWTGKGTDIDSNAIKLCSALTTLEKIHSSLSEALAQNFEDINYQNIQKIEDALFDAIFDAVVTAQ